MVNIKSDTIKEYHLKMVEGSKSTGVEIEFYSIIQQVRVIMEDLNIGKYLWVQQAQYVMI